MNIVRVARLLAMMITVAVKDRRWKAIHQVADRARPRMKKVMLAAFKAGRSTIDRDDLETALELKDEVGVLSIMATAITAFENHARFPLRDILFETMAASGHAAAKMLRSQLLRAAADGPTIKGWAFDVTNPRATEWARAHALELIDTMKKSDREAIRDLIEAAFEDQFDVDELADRITDVIGNADRAEVIARTETMRASNQGQIEAWDQALEAGLITGEEKKEWIVTPDDRLCPICEPLDGKTVALSEGFDVDGDEIDGPPAHPNCRCTIGLSL